MGQYYPIMLNLTGKTVLVVGGGPVAERKVHSLLSTGATIRVVSLSLTHGLQELAALGKIEYFPGEFNETDLFGSFLVFACTDDPAVNRRIYQLGEDLRIPVNVVDQPEISHFYGPAVVRRGDLTVAVSTGGSSPALAHTLKTKLERDFSPAWEKGLSILKEARDKIKARYPEGKERSRALMALGNEHIMYLIEKEDWDRLEEEIAKWL